MDLDYLLGAVFYGKNSNLNYISHNASLNAKYLTAEHINFYLKESFIRSDDPGSASILRRPRTTNTCWPQRRKGRFTGAMWWRRRSNISSDRKTAWASTTGTTSIERRARSAQNSQENYINPFFSYWFDRQNGISLDYGFTNGDFEKNPDLTGHRANARYTNRFSAKSSAFVEYTYSKRTFDASDLGRGL